MSPAKTITIIGIRSTPVARKGQILQVEGKKRILDLVEAGFLAIVDTDEEEESPDVD